VDAKPFDFPSAQGVRKAELDMAKALVNSLAAEWDPAKYTDEYRANLMRIIQGKLKGQEVRLDAPAEPRQAAVVDLMERLRQSLDQAASRHTRGSKARAKKPTPRKRTRAA
jgi:DNA end-binding protein Ku